MVKSLLFGLLAVPLVLAVAVAPVAARPHGASLARLQAELGLTDDQVQAIRQAHDAQRPVRRQLHASLRDARRALRDMVLEGRDDATIATQAAEVQQLLGQAVQLRVDTLRSVTQILTPEQREKLKTLRPTWH